MKEKLSRAARASKSVYDAGGEHYHFNMGCMEVGEKRFLTAMQEEIMEKQNLPFEDAALAAAADFKMMKRLQSGDGRFKSLRERVAVTTSVTTPAFDGVLA